MMAVLHRSSDIIAATICRILIPQFYSDNTVPINGNYSCIFLLSYMFPLDSPLLADLYKKYRSRLISRIARLTGCRETAADLAQDAYMRLLDQTGVVCPSNPAAYLFRIGRNLAIDHQRRPDFRQYDETSFEEELPSSFSGPDQQAVYRQECEQLWMAIMELPRPVSRALVLSVIEGVSQAAIAEELGVTERTVRRYISKGMAHCQRRLRNPLPPARYDR